MKHALSEILVVQHTPAEGLGLIEDVLRSRSMDVRLIGPESLVPENALERAAGVIVLGGPMSAYDGDRHPRLKDEMRLLEQALARGVPILGVCLGSQLLAAVLGARVYPGHAMELGWHEVTVEARPNDRGIFRASGERFNALHWHRDVFDLPARAKHIASSLLTGIQAFSYDDSAWGLLFHLEARIEEVRKMVASFPEEVALAGATGPGLIEATERHSPATTPLGRQIFEHWTDLIPAG